jgi:uncharacterized protein (TIRG00374 family)
MARAVGGSGSRWLRRGIVVLVVALLAEYFVLPQLIGAHEALSRVRGADAFLVAVALACEAGALMAYTGLTQAILDGSRVSYWRQLRIDLTGYGVGHVVPGGGATAAGLRYRLMTSAGIRPADAVACTAIEGAAELTALVFIFACGVALAAPHPGRHPFVVAAALIATALTGGIALLAVALRRYPARLRTLARSASRMIPFVAASSADVAVKRLADRAHRVTADVRSLGEVTAWALVNWLLDAMCLWMSLRAFGHAAPVGTLLVVYGIANLIALLPITPGGLGLVEGVVIPALVSFGTARGVAVLGVLTWRLIAFWLPIPVSWATAASLSRDVEAARHGHHPVGPK